MAVHNVVIKPAISYPSMYKPLEHHSPLLLLSSRHVLQQGMLYARLKGKVSGLREQMLLLLVAAWLAA